MIEFNQILEEMDVYESKFDEIDIFHKLSSFKKEEILEQDAFNHQAETLAFGFYEGNDEGRVLMFQIPPAPQGMPVSFGGHFYGREGGSLVSYLNGWRNI